MPTGKEKNAKRITFFEKWVALGRPTLAAMAKIEGVHPERIRQRLYGGCRALLHPAHKDHPLRQMAHDVKWGKGPWGKR